MIFIIQISASQICADRADRDRAVVRGRSWTHSAGVSLLQPLNNPLMTFIRHYWDSFISSILQHYASRDIFVFHLETSSDVINDMCACVFRATWPPWPIREFQRTWKGRTGLCSETSTRSMTGIRSESESEASLLSFPPSVPLNLSYLLQCTLIFSELLVFHDGSACVRTPVVVSCLCVCVCLTFAAPCHTVISWESWRNVWVIQTAWLSSSSNMWVYASVSNKCGWEVSLSFRLCVFSVWLKVAAVPQIRALAARKALAPCHPDVSSCHRSFVRRCSCGTNNLVIILIWL